VCDRIDSKEMRFSGEGFAGDTKVGNVAEVSFSDKAMFLRLVDKPFVRDDKHV